MITLTADAPEKRQHVSITVQMEDARALVVISGHEIPMPGRDLVCLVVEKVNAAILQLRDQRVQAELLALQQDKP